MPFVGFGERLFGDFLNLAGAFVEGLAQLERDFLGAELTTAVPGGVVPSPVAHVATCGTLSGGHRNGNCGAGHRRDQCKLSHIRNSW
jgi:hypothetical protein